jgi:hypothetical protein
MEKYLKYKQKYVNLIVGGASAEESEVKTMTILYEGKTKDIRDFLSPFYSKENLSYVKLEDLKIGETYYISKSTWENGRNGFFVLMDGIFVQLTNIQ